jgi:hypothetical protein
MGITEPEDGLAVDRESLRNLAKLVQTIQTRPMKEEDDVCVPPRARDEQSELGEPAGGPTTTAEAAVGPAAAAISAGAAAGSQSSGQPGGQR